MLTEQLNFKPNQTCARADPPFFAGHMSVYFLIVSSPGALLQVS